MTPDFFLDRNTYRTFEEVVAYIHTHFEVKNSAFRVWEKSNSDSENQRACCVLAYAIYMRYTFKQTKALFGEHDHICLALPYLKKERNIYQLNLIYDRLLADWVDSNMRLCDYAKYLDIPSDILILK